MKQFTREQGGALIASLHLVTPGKQQPKRARLHMHVLGQASCVDGRIVPRRIFVLKPGTAQLRVLMMLGFTPAENLGSISNRNLKSRIAIRP